MSWKHIGNKEGKWYVNRGGGVGRGQGSKRRRKGGGISINVKNDSAKIADKLFWQDVENTHQQYFNIHLFLDIQIQIIYITYKDF